MSRSDKQKQLDVLKYLYIIIERKYRWSNCDKFRAKCLNSMKEVKEVCIKIKECK